MRRFINIDQKFSAENDLNLTEASLLGYLFNAAWAEGIVLDGLNYKWISRKKILEDLPIVFKTKDRVYRVLKSLEESGLIKYKKEGRKDCVFLTKLGRKWNCENSVKKPNKPETRQKSRANSVKKPNREKSTFQQNQALAEDNSVKKPTYRDSMLHDIILIEAKKKNPLIFDEILNKQQWQEILQMQLKTEGLVHDYQKNILPIILHFIKTEFEAGNLNYPVPKIKRKMIPYVKVVLRNGGLKTKEHKKQENKMPVYLKKIS